MTDIDKILSPITELTNKVDKQGNALVTLQEGQKALQANVNGLQTDVKELKEGQQTLDLKVEAFHTEQSNANMQILTTLTDMNEMNTQHMDKRVTRIEKHLNLQPIK